MVKLMVKSLNINIFPSIDIIPIEQFELIYQFNFLGGIIFLGIFRSSINSWYVENCMKNE